MTAIISRLEQSILSGCPSQLQLEEPKFFDCGPSIDSLLRSTTHHTLGLDIHLTPSTGLPSLLALSTPTRILLLRLPSPPPRKPPPALLALFSSADTTFASFQLPRIALSLQQLGLPVNGVDLSTAFAPNPREGMGAHAVLYARLEEGEVQADCDWLWTREPGAGQEGMYVALRSWIASKAATAGLIVGVSHVDTANLEPHHLAVLAQHDLFRRRVYRLRPDSYTNDFDSVQETHDGTLVVENTRFKTKIRASRQSVVKLITHDGASHLAVPTRHTGKKSFIRMVDGSMATGAGVSRIEVYGRDELTNAELAHDYFLLRLLQGEIPWQELDESEIIRRIFWPTPEDKAALVAVREKFTDNADLYTGTMKLNDSQRQAAGTLLSPEPRIVLIQGPPGTGKTRCIAAAVHELVEFGQTAWLCCQSNIGTLNIATALLKNGFTNFKLLVSKDFGFEWHEHLYEQMRENVIRSDELPQSPFLTEDILAGTPIILCTLSMLSSPALEERGVFQVVPVRTLIVDEASQIPTGEYLHLFHRLRDTLQKVAFFGDPKQLGPYGSEQVKELESVYTAAWLRPSVVFLNTSYRLPLPIAEWLSEAIYNGKLKADHPISDPSCCAFVDVDKSSESKQGTSWRNLEEENTIVNLVRNYYRHRNFVIVSPYDSQRNSIEGALRRAGLPYEGRVFNLDSYQGNECDYILISLVRTTRPGFLIHDNRMNVMLSRATKGMVIVSQRKYLKTGGLALVAKMANYWEKKRPWVDWRDTANGYVDLPGCPAPNPRERPASPVVSIRSSPTSRPGSALGYAAAPVASSSKAPMNGNSVWGGADKGHKAKVSVASNVVHTWQLSEAAAKKQAARDTKAAAAAVAAAAQPKNVICPQFIEHGQRGTKNCKTLHTKRSEKPVISHKSKLYRTKPCKFFAKGNCVAGDACSFLHDEAPPKVPRVPVAPEMVQPRRAETPVQGLPTPLPSEPPSPVKQYAHVQQQQQQQQQPAKVGASRYDALEYDHTSEAASSADYESSQTEDSVELSPTAVQLDINAPLLLPRLEEELAAIGERYYASNGAPSSKAELLEFVVYHLFENSKDSLDALESLAARYPQPLAKHIDDPMFGGWPPLFWAIVWNEPGFKLVEFCLRNGADVNATGPHGIPALAFSILHHHSFENSVMTKFLLLAGADPFSIPASVLTPVAELDQPLIPITPASSWCTQPWQAKLKESMSTYIQYIIYKACARPAPTLRQAKVLQASGLAKLPKAMSVFVGGDTAYDAMLDAVVAHRLNPDVRPLILAFTGQRSHGKRRLAHNLGTVLDIPLLAIDLVNAQHENSLFGQTASGEGMALNDFLQSNAGKQALVFLDEPRKLKGSLRLVDILSQIAQGSFTDKRVGPVDVSSIIWIVGTEAGSSTIGTYMEKHPERFVGGRALARGLQRLQELIIKKNLKKLGDAIPTYVTAVVPFLPFTLPEAAALASQELLRLKRQLISIIDAESLAEQELFTIQDEYELARWLARKYSPERGAESVCEAAEQWVENPVRIPGPGAKKTEEEVQWTAVKKGGRA